ncbi:MAG: anti-phage defense ZorAB system protein ZorA [Magnetococcus sp. DMHC-6]
MAENIESLSSLQRYLSPIFNLFKDPDVVIYIAGVMLVFALGILLWFRIIQIHPMLSTLDRVKRALKSISDYHDFVDQFSQFDEVMTREKILRHGWEEFKETLIMPNATESGQIRNTVRPSVYLHMGSVAGRLNLTLYQSFPNYFVGFGLLFTFIGLVAALHFASEGVAGNVQQAKDSLENLLTAATFKFMTSIAGLLSSLLLSMLIKYWILYLHRQFDEFCQLLEERMIFVTPVSLAALQIEELKKQTLQLERFNTDFAVEVAKALEMRFNNSLGSVIGQAMAPMVHSIEGITKSIGTMSQETMLQLVDRFKTSMDGSVGTEMNALVQTLTLLQETLHKTISGLGESSGSFGERVDKTAERLESLIAGAGQNMENSIASSASLLTKTLDTASQSLQADSLKVSEEFSSIIEKIAKGFYHSLSKSATVWKEELLASANEVRRAMDEAGQLLTKRMDTSTQRLEETIFPFAEQMQGVNKTLYLLDDRLKSLLENFDSSILRLLQVIMGMDQSFQQLQESGAPIAQTAERFSKAAQQMESTFQSMKNTQEEITNTARIVYEGAQQVQNNWENYRQRFEKVDEDLSSIFDKIQEGTEAYHYRVHEYVIQIDHHFTNSMNLLGGGIEQLKETIEDLVDAAEKMASKNAGEIKTEAPIEADSVTSSRNHLREPKNALLFPDEKPVHLETPSLSTTPSNSSNKWNSQPIAVYRENDLLRSHHVEASALPFPEEKNLESKLQKFVTQYGLRIIDLRENGGSMCIETDDANPPVSQMLRNFGFKYKENKGWYATSLRQ